VDLINSSSAEWLAAALLTWEEGAMVMEVVVEKEGGCSGSIKSSSNSGSTTINSSSNSGSNSTSKQGQPQQQ
jgi:hypothetical protein